MCKWLYIQAQFIYYSYYVAQDCGGKSASLSLNATFRRLYRDIMRTGCCCSGAVGATLLHHRNGKSLFFRCDDDDFLFYVGLLRVDGYKPHGMLLPFCVCCRVSLSFRQRELRKLVKL